MAKKILCVFVLVFLLACSFASCGNDNNNDTNPSHTHAYGEWEIVKAASCTSEGSKERYCPCGEKQTSTIPQLEHSFGEWITVKNPTTTETGLKEQSCACGEKRSETIEKIAIATTVNSAEWIQAFDFSRFQEIAIEVDQTEIYDDYTLIITGSFTYCANTVYMDYVLYYEDEEEKEEETVQEYESGKAETFGDTVCSDILRGFWSDISKRSDLGFLRFTYDNETSAYSYNYDYYGDMCKVSLYFENGNIAKITFKNTSETTNTIDCTYIYTCK